MISLSLMVACLPAPDVDVVPTAADEATLVVEGSLLRRVGSAVFNVGDITGDGADELALGWSYGDLVVQPRLSVFRGGTRGRLSVDNADLTIVQNSDRGWFVDEGECREPMVPGQLNVLPMGDIDGDGVGELAVAVAGDGARGQVLVFAGHQLQDALRDGNTELYTSDAWWTLEPPGGVYAFGTDLAVAEVDGDGVPDLVIGAPLSEDPRRAGRVFVVQGWRLGSAPSDNYLAHWVGWSVSWTEEGALMGERVVNAGDLNGDGRDEIATLAPGCEAEGANGHLLVLDSSQYPDIGQNTWLVPRQLVSAYTRSGGLRANLVAAGDSDQDGFGELILGGVQEDPELGPELLVFSGFELAAGVPVYPSGRFRTGGDSRSQLASLQGPKGLELLSHDGDQVVRVSDPHEASGWHVAERWLAPCAGLELQSTQRLMATGDFLGTGREQLLVADPHWPCGALEGQTGGAVLLEP